LKVVIVALLYMPSQLSCAADRNSQHYLSVGGGQWMDAAVSFPILTTDIGQLWGRPFFSCRQLMAGRHHAATRLQRAVAQIEQVQGTRSRAQLGLADLQIALGTLKRVMT